MRIYLLRLQLKRRSIPTPGLVLFRHVYENWFVCTFYIVAKWNSCVLYRGSCLEVIRQELNSRYKVRELTHHSKQTFHLSFTLP